MPTCIEYRISISFIFAINGEWFGLIVNFIICWWRHSYFIPSFMEKTNSNCNAYYYFIMIPYVLIATLLMGVSHAYFDHMISMRICINVIRNNTYVYFICAFETWNLFLKLRTSFRIERKQILCLFLDADWMNVQIGVESTVEPSIQLSLSNE